MVNRMRTGVAPTLQEAAVGKLRVVSAWLRDYITAIKNGHIHPFTSMERKIREATRNEPWGPTGTTLNELAEASHNSTDCEIIFAVLQLRLGYPPEKWRNVYKALVVLDFLIRRGSDQSLQITNEELIYKLDDLETFTFLSPEGKDQGVNVRHRAKAVKELILDPVRLQSERAAFQRQRKVYQGFTRDQLAMGKPFHDDQDIPSPRSSRSTGLRRTLSESSMQEPKQPPYSGEKELGSFTVPPGSTVRNAGETKGVTMEMNKKQLAELKQLLDLPQNRYCADCIGGGAAARASWASINNGVFLCMRCAGVHRGLGTHVSKVRSCTLDTWLPEQVHFMAQTGNIRANEYFEARLDPELKPAYGSVDLEPFIRRKYTVLAYAEGFWPPSASLAERDAPSAEPSREEEQLEAAGSAAHPASQKSHPRLQGRRPGRQNSTSAAVKPLTRLVSVPLPAAAQPQAPEGSPGPQQPARPAADLMAFVDDTDKPSTAMLSPVAASGQTASLLDNDAGYAAISGHNSISDAARQGDLFLYQAVSTSAAQPSAQMTDHAHGWAPASYFGSGMQQPQSLQAQQPAAGLLHGAEENGFQGESVRDWGQGYGAPVKRPQLPYLHVHASSIGGDSELGSVASMPFLTPRFTALCGPGRAADGSQMYQQAPAKYSPPDMAYKSRSGPWGVHQPSALYQSTKQWTANAQQGDKGVLDDLVLHAMADLPPSKAGGNYQDMIAAGQAPKPPSMLQQRAEMLQSLAT